MTNQRSDQRTRASQADLLEAAALTLSRVFQSLRDPRHSVLLRERFFASKPRTLAALGRDFGVSAARVGQLEGPALAGVEEALSPADKDLLNEAANILLPKGETVASVSSLGEMWPEAVQIVGGAELPLPTVLGRLVPALAESEDQADTGQGAQTQGAQTQGAQSQSIGWEEVDGWLVRPNLEEAKTQTERLLRESADPYGVASISAARVYNPTPPPTKSLAEAPARISAVDPAESSDVLVQWLTECGIKTSGTHALLDTGSLADYAAGVLAVRGQPLEVSDLLDSFDHARRRSPRSVVNALSQDKRFQRTSRSQWGLAEWDQAGYTTIRDLIGKAIDKGGGEVPLEDLIENLVTKAGVSAQSVATYASASPYRSVEGVVRRRDKASRGIVPEVGAKGLYKAQGGWVYRVRVTKNHLRGSGTMVPQGVAAALSLTRGERVVFAADPKRHAISWRGVQPSLGTIRVHLAALNAKEEDEVLLHYGDDKTFSASFVRTPSGDPLFDAVALVSTSEPETGEEALRVLVEALGSDEQIDIAGLNVTEAAHLLATKFASKGDEDVATLLREVS